MVVKNHKYGLLDRNLREIMPCKYDEPIVFDGGFAKIGDGDAMQVFDENGRNALVRFGAAYLPAIADSSGRVWVTDTFQKKGRIYKSGKIIIPVIYDELKVLGDGWNDCAINGLHGIVNDSGRMVIPVQYQSVALLPGQSRFVARNTAGRYGVITSDNQIAVPFLYDDYHLPAGKSDFLPLQKGYLWGCVSTATGRTLIPFLYYNVTESGGQGFFRVRSDFKCGLADSAHRSIVPAIYEDAKWLGKGLYAVQTDKGWKCIDGAGTDVIPVGYEDFETIEHGLIAAKQGRWGVIDKKGKVIVPFAFNNPPSFRGGVVAMPLDDDDDWRTPGTYYDTTGEIVRKHPAHYGYRSIGMLSEGITIVVDSEGYSSYVNRSGRLISTATYQNAGNFSEGLALVQIGKKFGFVDKKGTEIVAPTLDYAVDFSDSMALFYGSVGCGYINNRGDITIPALYEAGTSFYKGYSSVKKTGHWGLIDKKGRVVLGFKYDSSLVFSEGVSSSLVNGRWSYIDTTGKVRINMPERVMYCDKFYKGKALVITDSGYGFIDKSGKWLTKAGYEFIERHSSGISSFLVSGASDYGENDKYGLLDVQGRKLKEALFREILPGGKSDLIVVSHTFGYGVFNSAGTEVVPCIYEEIMPDYQNEGLLAACLNGKWGYLNKAGKLIIGYQFDKALPFSEGLATVMKNGKWAFIDKAGKFVVTFQ
jgi:hypothetical protein